jgi:hypothetical protein
VAPSNRYNQAVPDGFPLVGGRTSVSIVGSCIEIHAPRYFGTSSISVTADDVAFFDLREAGDDTDDGGPELTENTRVAIFTTPSLLHGKKRVPNVMLLFQQAVELPRVTWLGRLRLRGLVLHRARGRLGRKVDGLFVQALDPDAALAILSNSGATPTTAPVKWLKSHRADRLTWPLEPLMTSDQYLTGMGRMGLAGVVAVIVAIALVVAPLGVFRFLAILGFAGVIASRNRFDHLQSGYRQLMLRQRSRAKHGSLVGFALRSLVPHRKPAP